MTDLTTEDLRTADEFAARFEHIHLDRPTPHRTDHSPPARRRRRVSLLIGAAAAATVAVVTATSISLSGGTDRAFAGWTPVPRAATGTELAAIVEVCNARTEVANGVFDSNSVNEIRGRIALIVDFDADGAFHRCTAELQARGWYAFGLGDYRADSGSGPYLEGGGGPDNMTWILHGRNAAAASAELDVPGYPTVTATVSNGVYLLWWPADRDPYTGKQPELELRLRNTEGQLIETINW